MRISMWVKLGVAAALSATALGASSGLAQPAAGAPRQVKQWWVEKTQGGVYHAPMRPVWHVADLKKMHAGQSSWSEQIIKDPEQDATYNSAAPGTKFVPRIHPDSGTVFVVTAGQLHFEVEGQQPFVATRGSIVHILKTTVFSYDVVGTENALWVEDDPANYQVLYPSSGAQPKPVKGGKIVSVGFNNTPPAYAAPNKLHYNLFDAIAACEKAGAVVRDDHLFASPLLGWVNPADNKCGTGRLNVGNTPVIGAPPLPPFNPKSDFGHMHAGPAEWWIVQVGRISGKFENQGEFVAEEGDVLYAAPMMWHQMAALAPSGPSVRLAMGGYELINMNAPGGN